MTGDVIWHGRGLGDIAGLENPAGLLESFIGAAGHVRRGIRVNAVAPQLLDSPPTGHLPGGRDGARGRAGGAGLIAFLVSDVAAPVSGAILPADGALAGPSVPTSPAGPRPVPGWPAPARGASR